METTQTGVSHTPIAQTSSLPTEETFQGLFDAGALETPKEGEKPKEGKAAPVAEAPVAEQENALEQGAEKPAEGEEETKDYESLDAYLKDAGVDPESFQTLPVTVKVDGQTKQVPLAEVIKSYQLEGHVNNKSIQLSQQQQEFAKEQEAARGLYRQQLTNSDALLKLAQTQLMGDYNRVNWQQLRVENPAEYAALSTEFQQRQGQIQQHLAQISQAQQAEAQRSEQERQKALPQEREKMLAVRPEWRDPAKMEAASKEISTYARKLGFSPAELGSIYDHRFMLVLSDAARFAQMQAAKPAALKQVRAAPVMAKPGTRTNRDPKQAARTQAVERFNKNPRDVDAQAAVFESLMES